MKGLRKHGDYILKEIKRQNIPPGRLFLAMDMRSEGVPLSSVFLNP